MCVNYTVIQVKHLIRSFPLINGIFVARTYFCAYAKFAAEKSLRARDPITPLVHYATDVRPRAVDF